MSSGPLCVKPGSLLFLDCFFFGAVTVTVVCVCCTVLSTLLSTFAGTACFTSVTTGGNSDNSASYDCHIAQERHTN
jgi:hypothetical protein